MILFTTRQGAYTDGHTVLDRSRKRQHVAPMHENAEDLRPAELAAWRGMLRAQAALLHDMDAELTAGHGLALRSYEVLLHLEDAPRHRLRMSDLSHSVLLSASGVSRLVDRLERDGLVRRERCSADGRGYWAVLTGRGERSSEKRAPPIWPACGASSCGTSPATT